MLSLRFDFFNLIANSGELVRQNQVNPAFVVVQFAPQHIAEQAFFEAKPGAGASDDLPTPPVNARIAGLSRLAFKVPDDVDSIPYRLAELLDWARWEQKVVPVALPPNPGNQRINPTIRAPKSNESSLEIPWDLIMSPNRFAGWSHATGPVTFDDHTELWHTRLGERKPDSENPGEFIVDENDATNRKMRAVWTPGFKKGGPVPDPDDGPFRMSTNPEERWELVTLTSDFKIAGFKPLPVDVDRFMLTSLGAWMQTRGDWPLDSPGTVLHWTHRATMGRDHYVRIIKKGFLFPFGHRAVLVKISERKFQPVDTGPQAGSIGAFVRQRQFIVVTQPLREFFARDTPFKRVRITTVKTPDLNKVDGADPHPLTIVKKPSSSQPYKEKAFWPAVGNQDFYFHIIATDKDEKPIEFTAPLIFVRDDIAGTAADMKNVAERYNSTTKARRNRPMQGQKIALAPSTPAKPGDAALETNTVMFKAYQRPQTGKPRFSWRLDEANVRLQAIEQVKGSSLGGTDIVLYKDYVDHNFKEAGVFAKLKDAKSLNYGSDNAGDKSGGLVTPNMDITGLSRKTGPVGGPLAANPPPDFDPKDFFKGAKFLGINLADVVLGAAFSDLAKVPKTISRVVYPGNDTTKLPEKIVTELEWHPDVKADPLHIFEPAGDAALDVRATFVTPLDPPGEPTFDIVGDLRNFQIKMIGSGSPFILLTFNKLTFSVKKGSKPDVDVDITDVTFTGALEFVNELKDFLESAGTGFDIEITPTQVSAGYTLGLPTISVGIFSLANISFSAGVILPFTGDPVRARFAFCERENQFRLTYTIFGGGGYFEIHLGVDGIEKFAAALEFGASCSIDLGVASGGVEIMAGIYFEMGEEAGKEICKLTGYVRLGGELDILGLIYISLEFNLSLTYDFTDDSVWGQASLSVEVEVLMFSASVEVSCEKKFGGGGGDGFAAIASGKSGSLPAGVSGPDPITFEDLMTENEWQTEYCGAFAAAAL